MIQELIPIIGHGASIDFSRPADEYSTPVNTKKNLKFRLTDDDY